MLINSIILGNSQEFLSKSHNLLYKLHDSSIIFLENLTGFVNFFQKPRYQISLISVFLKENSQSLVTNEGKTKLLLIVIYKF